jgi:hypothetical protein
MLSDKNPLVSRTHRTAAGWLTRSLVGLLLMAGLVGLTAVPASAATGTLTKISWSVNNSQTAKTGITYSYAFTTATAATLTAVTMTVPSGTAGTPAVGTVYGLGAGTVALSGTTLTYTVTTPASVAASIPVYLSFTGLTNTATAGSYTSVITTDKSGPTAVDTGTSGSVTFGSSSTAATVNVGQTLTFTNNNPAFSLDVDPTMLNSNQTASVVLTVQTNASQGYTLSMSDTGLSRTSPSYTIPDVSTGPAVGVATFPSKGWGVSGILTTGGTDGATLASGLAGGDWVGYPSTPATFLSATGPTGTTADTLTLTDQVGVDYSVPDGTYTDTINYVATPTY